MPESTQTVQSLRSVEVPRGEVAHADGPVHTASQIGNTTRYWISPTVHACSTPGGVVLLDLARNKYCGVSNVDAVLLSRVVEDWPLPASPACADPGHMPCEALARLLDEFLSAGLLTAAPRHRLIPSTKVDCSGDLIAVGDEVGGTSAPQLHHIANFIMAFVSAKAELRWCSLLTIAQKASARRIPLPATVTASDIKRAIELVSVFRRLRPYAFTATGQCLLHALCLVKFLACYDVPATWVIGVRTNPWGAHSWAQRGIFLLDTNPEKVCRYTPIFAI